jgi:ADP-ribosyl-[dinitrogen reductase] hydrolase
MEETKQNKFIGCMKGLAIGDTLGAPFEFCDTFKIKRYLRENPDWDIKINSSLGKELPAGFYTDDTAMTICLAESLLEKGFDIQDQFTRFKKWHYDGYATPFDDRSYGIGQQTFRKLMLQKSDITNIDDPKAGGNGGLMRIAPIALYYQGDYQNIIEKSILACRITHNNKIAEATCVIFNIIISLIIDGIHKENLLEEACKIVNQDILNQVESILNIKYENIEDYSFPVSGYTLNTLQIALWSFFSSDNYEDGIKKVILLGNDTDTFGAVTGALLGTYYGYNSIPSKWKGQVIKCNYINKLAENLHNKTI